MAGRRRSYKRDARGRFAKKSGGGSAASTGGRSISAAPSRAAIEAPKSRSYKARAHGSGSSKQLARITSSNSEGAKRTRRNIKQTIGDFIKGKPAPAVVANAVGRQAKSLTSRGVSGSIVLRGDNARYEIEFKRRPNSSTRDRVR